VQYTVQSLMSFVASRRRKDVQLVNDLEWIVNDVKANSRSETNMPIKGDNDIQSLKQLEQPVAGTKISIHNCDDDIFYDGVIIGHDIQVTTTRILFEDGHEEQIALRERRYRILE
jgi:hypothetical protein